MSNAINDVISERKRQQESEGWSTAHDDKHKPGELAAAGSRYATNAAACLGIHPPCLHFGASWPWDEMWFKATTPRRDLVKAGALILAEIERLDRAAARDAEQYICSNCDEQNAYRQEGCRNK